MNGRGLVLVFFVGATASVGCDKNGQGVGGDCSAVVQECPPGTIPRSIRQALDVDSATEVTLADLGVIDLETRAFLRKESSSGCEYACVQAVLCPSDTKTCFHNGCFACLGEESDYCSNCIEF